MTPRYDFASDNTAGCAPEALDALTRCNTGFASGYGTDAVSEHAAQLIRERLGVGGDVAVRFVASGTAANALSLAALAQPHEAVLAHTHAHVCTDETGAPGFFGSGVGLIELAGPSGKIDTQALGEALARPDVSYRQSPAALSLTNATEYGTVYTADEVRRLTQQAKGLPVHLDGARLANAVAAGFDLRAIKDLGVTILILGGTKAGMTPTEAIALFDPRLARRFDARLKHAGQLTSKGRFLAAPWVGMLEGDAWVKHARHANAMAQRLAEIFRTRTPFAITHPVQANAVFVQMDEPSLDRLRQRGFFVYRFLDGSVRFMCSWATTPAAVEELTDALVAIS